MNRFAIIRFVYLSEFQIIPAPNDIRAESMFLVLVFAGAFAGLIFGGDIQDSHFIYEPHAVLGMAVSLTTLYTVSWM